MRSTSTWRWRAGLAVLAAAAVSAVAVACGGDESTAEAQQGLCTALGEFDVAVANLRDLNVNSTVEQWQESRDAVREEWDDVREQATDVQEARYDEVESAYDDLESALDDVPDDATVGEAMQQVAPQLAAVQTSWESYYSQLGCA